MKGFFDQHPVPGNAVTLDATRGTDRHGVPRARVRWTMTEADLASVAAFLDRLRAQAEASGVGRLDTRLPDRVEDWGLTGIHSHFMGTTRMGTDPADSVTDGSGRVHGQARLFVSGPGLFRTYSYANPVLTIAALALRVADGVAASMGEDG
jgi:choline dehydrogenase-like flavoprotein